MAGYDDKIKELEDLIANSQYNKRTQKAIGLYKAQLAKLKEKESSRGGGGKSDGYAVRKSGDGTVVLLGFPSVGKSTLLNRLTNAESEVAAYEFTTVSVVPGTMPYKHAQIQILDVPGIVTGAASGKGRGAEVLSVLRSADLVLIVVDVNKPEHHDAILKEVYESGIRLDKKPPEVRIKKTAKDGVKIHSTVRLTKTSPDVLEAVLKEFKISNADVVIRDNITVDEFIDCIEANKVYIPSLTVLNKVDMVSESKAKSIGERVGADLMMSAKMKTMVADLRDLIFDKLNLIRIFLKEPGKDPDMEIPLIVRKGSSIKDVASKLHRQFENRFKFARVWGRSAKFPGQKQSLKHRLKDSDVLELHLS